MREVYIVATADPAPLPEELVRERFEGDDVEIEYGGEGRLFSVVADEARVEVRFETRASALGWTPELLTGAPEDRARLEAAKGFYRVSFEPGKPQGPVAVFE